MGNKSEPIKRRNHFVSEFYLSGFPPSGCADELFYVHDLKLKETRQDIPSNVGWRRDYYRLKDSPDQNELENGLAEYVEGPASAIFRSIIETKRLPEGKEFKSLLKWILLIAVGVPTTREGFALEDAYLLRKTLKESAKEDRQLFHEEVEAILRAGIKPSIKLSIENVLSPEFDRCSMEFPAIWHIQNFLEYISDVLSRAWLLEKRSWVLLEAEQNAGYFICSDRPVASVPLSLEGRVPTRRYIMPDFAKDTLVVMPLSRNLYLQGEFAEKTEERSFADKKLTTLSNSFTISTAFLDEHKLRFIYSAEEDFIWWRPDGAICGRDDLYKLLDNVEPFADLMAKEQPDA